MSSHFMRTTAEWNRRERRGRKVLGGVILALGLLMAAGAPLDVIHKLETGETTVYHRHAGSRVLLRAVDPRGFRAQVFGGGLLLFACGAAFAVFGRGLITERAPVQRGFDAKWELDNAQRRPLDPRA